MDTYIFAFILRKWKVFHQCLLIPQSGKTELIFFIPLYNFIKKDSGTGVFLPIFRNF